MRSGGYKRPDRTSRGASPGALGGLAGAALVAALGADGNAAEIRFTEVGSQAGVAGDVYSSATFHGLGVNWIDYDRDGWPDLFVVGGDAGRPPHLFHNRADGTFDRADHLLPVLPAVEMSGSRFADVDRDGDPDIFIYTDNPEFLTGDSNLPDGPPDLLLRNLWIESGAALPLSGPLFVEVAAAAGLEDLADPPFGDLPGYRSGTAAWLDYDRDGCIDLFVGHLVLNSAGAEANRDRLYRNLCEDGPARFEDVTAASGLDARFHRPALAVLAGDFNGDLWPDLYVVNVTGLPPATSHQDSIYFNDGAGPDGTVTFTEVGDTMPGVGDDAKAGMGIDAADVDLDGDWDLYISDLLATDLDAAPLGNVLYLGNGDGTWADNSAPVAGVTGHNSWGVNFFDADRDGWEDLFVAYFDFGAEPPEVELFYRNDGDGTFTNVARDAGLSTGDSRGSAVADYDRDGDLDLAVVRQNGGLQLYRNDTPNAGHWLALELVGTASNRDAIGATVEVTAGRLEMRRQVKGGSSSHSQDSLAVHFGLGESSTAARVRVLWPSGLETVLEDQAADRYLTVVEGELFRDGFETGDKSAWR